MYYGKIPGWKRSWSFYSQRVMGVEVTEDICHMLQFSGFSGVYYRPLLLKSSDMFYPNFIELFSYLIYIPSFFRSFEKMSYLGDARAAYVSAPCVWSVLRLAFRCFHVEVFDVQSWNFVYIAFRTATSRILFHFLQFSREFLEILINFVYIALKDKYPNFEVGLKCIIMVF